MRYAFLILGQRFNKCQPHFITFNDGNLYFRNLHIEFSLHTNFQLDWTILTFSMTSPNTPSPHTSRWYGNLYFRNLHMELSLHTYFQLDWPILKYSVVSWPHPRSTPFFIGNLYFRNLHIEFGLPSNFQLDCTILTFSMTSPTTPSLLPSQGLETCIFVISI